MTDVFVGGGAANIDSMNVSVDFSTYNKLYPNSANKFTLRQALN